MDIRATQLCSMSRLKWPCIRSLYDSSCFTASGLQLAGRTCEDAVVPCTVDFMQMGAVKSTHVILYLDDLLLATRS